MTRSKLVCPSVNSEWLFDKTTTDMTEQELHEIIAVDENYRIELTTSTGDIDKFLEELASSLMPQTKSLIMSAKGTKLSVW